MMFGGERPEQHAGHCKASRRSRGRVGALPRRLLHHLGLQARGADPFRERPMTTQPAPTPHSPEPRATLSHRRWQRLLALSGVVFAPLFVIGWVTSVPITPTTPHQIRRGRTGRMTTRGRAASALSRCCSQPSSSCTSSRAIRSALESAESPARGSAQLARVAFAGALTGIVGMTMAFVSIANCEFRGCRRKSRGE